jgi:hypothetical protein
MMGAQAFPGYNYFSPFQGLHPYVFYCPGFEARFYCPGFEFGSKSFIGCRYSVGNVLSVGKQALHVRNEVTRVLDIFGTALSATPDLLTGIEGPGY